MADTLRSSCILACWAFIIQMYRNSASHGAARAARAARAGPIGAELVTGPASSVSRHQRLRHAGLAAKWTSTPHRHRAGRRRPTGSRSPSRSRLLYCRCARVCRRRSEQRARLSIVEESAARRPKAVLGTIRQSTRLRTQRRQRRGRAVERRAGESQCRRPAI